MQPSIRSEINPIRLIITHKPGSEHNHITPSNLKEEAISEDGIKPNPDYLLFDDLIYVEKAAKEHEELYNTLHYFTDGNCYEFTDLLNVVLKDELIREKLIVHESPLIQQQYIIIKKKNIS